MMPIMTPYRTPYNKLKQQRGLQKGGGLRHNSPTTKPLEASCAALTCAFFVSAIQQACYLAARVEGMADAKKRPYSNEGGLIGLNTRPIAGNKSSRLVAVVETRRPVNTKAGRPTLTKPLGGHSMPTPSNRLAAFSFTVNLPADSFIQSINATFSAGDWIAYIRTTRDQFAPICNTNGKTQRFPTLDSLAQYLADAGVCDLDVSLLGLGKGAA